MTIDLAEIDPPESTDPVQELAMLLSELAGGRTLVLQKYGHTEDSLKELKKNALCHIPDKVETQWGTLVRKAKGKFGTLRRSTMQEINNMNDDIILLTKKE